jgi:hypothetical protein
MSKYDWPSAVAFVVCQESMAPVDPMLCESFQCSHPPDIVLLPPSLSLSLPLPDFARFGSHGARDAALAAWLNRHHATAPRPPPASQPPSLPPTLRPPPPAPLPHHRHQS